MKILKTIIGTTAMLALTSTAYAIPLLQVDITGGSYDTTTETIVCPDTTCEVLALLTPPSNTSEADLAALLAETYYLSIALTPKTSTSGDYGSFTVDGDTYDVTDDMVYGVPPLEANLDQDAGDLSKHGIFETYFTEVSFKFVAADQCAKYNSADNPGGCTAGTGTYYVAFDVDSTLLNSAFGLHFDLYNTVVKTGGDIDRDDFAPFSHDGQTGCCEEVPEPGTLALLGIGLLGLGLARRRKLEI